MMAIAARTRIPVRLPVMRAAIFRALLLFGNSLEGFLRDLRVLRYRQGRPDQFFYAADLESLIRRRDSDGMSFVSRSARAAYSVNIIFSIFRQVVIYYKLYSHNIYSARRYIGGDEYPVFTGFKTFERLSALGQ